MEENKELDAWVETLFAVAEKENMVILTSVFCCGCEEYEQISAYAIPIQLDLSAIGKMLNGMIIFMCKPCSELKYNRKDLIEKIQFWIKTGSIQAYLGGTQGPLQTMPKELQ